MNWIRSCWIARKMFDSSFPFHDWLMQTGCQQSSWLADAYCCQRSWLYTWISIERFFPAVCKVFAQIWWNELKHSPPFWVWNHIKTVGQSNAVVKKFAGLSSLIVYLIMYSLLFDYVQLTRGNQVYFVPAFYLIMYNWRKVTKYIFGYVESILWIIFSESVENDTIYIFTMT